MRICVQVLHVFRFCSCSGSILTASVQKRILTLKSGNRLDLVLFCVFNCEEMNSEISNRHETRQQNTWVVHRTFRRFCRDTNRRYTPFIFFCRVEFSACRRRSSPSTGPEVELGGALDAAAAPRSFRPWFSCSSCSICVHSWKNPDQNQD